MGDASWSWKYRPFYGFHSSSSCLPLQYQFLTEIRFEDSNMPQSSSSAAYIQKGTNEGNNSDLGEQLELTILITMGNDKCW